VGEVTDPAATANIAATPKKHSSNDLSVHQGIRSATRGSQQPISPIGFLFLKLPPPPCAVLLVITIINGCTPNSSILKTGLPSKNGHPSHLTSQLFGMSGRLGLVIFPVGTTQIAALSRGTKALYRHVKTEEESGSVPPRSDLAP
jgi:hypothetical protein